MKKIRVEFSVPSTWGIVEIEVPENATEDEIEETIFDEFEH